MHAFTRTDPVCSGHTVSVQDPEILKRNQTSQSEGSLGQEVGGVLILEQL